MSSNRPDPWLENRPIVNGWLAIPSAYSAETMAQAGWDSLTIDMQHGLQDYDSMVQCVRGVELHNGFPMARVESSDQAMIGKVLDAGVRGIICPMVNTADQAASLVEACRYPPSGTRSFGPTRLAVYGESSGSPMEAAKSVRCIAMIETREAVDNLDAILDVPGLDGIYVGPGDLGISYGLEPRLDRDEPEILRIFEEIVVRTRRRGLRAGIHTGSADYAIRAMSMGFGLVTVGGDAMFMLRGARHAATAAKSFAQTWLRAPDEPPQAADPGPAEGDVVAALMRELPSGTVLAPEQAANRRLADWSGAAAGTPRAIVLPRTTEEVAVAVRICHRHVQALVVQGGLTGLAGAAVPRDGEIVISLERMSGVLELDAPGATMTAWAGTPLQVVQEQAARAGLFYGVDIGARGTCTIGGTVATNAGGTRVLRYGMTRQNILGLEAVLADGTVVSALNKMLKNNTGYDWKQLLIGSEGTLGVISKVVVSLQPLPGNVSCALVATRDFDSALELLRRAGTALAGPLHAFEAMWPSFQRVAVETCGLQSPLPIDGRLWVLLEAECPSGPFEEFLEKALEDELLLHAVVSTSLQQREQLWALRESPAEFPRLFPGLVGFDVGIPRARMSAAVARIDGALKAKWPNVTALSYGHVADGNLHLVVYVPDLSEQARHQMHALVYGLVQSYDGAISAEHGIGQIKTPWLALSRSEHELNLMRSLKRTLDPAGILNRGRIFG